MILVKDVIKKKSDAFNRVSPTTLVIEALHMMKALNVNYVAVLSNGEYRGIFCETDYARNIILRGLHSNTTEVQEVMTVNLPVVGPYHTMAECKTLLELHNSRYLLAFDENNKFLGVITTEDVLHFIKPEVEPLPVSDISKTNQLEEYF